MKQEQFFHKQHCCLAQTICTNLKKLNFNASKIMFQNSKKTDEWSQE